MPKLVLVSLRVHDLRRLPRRTTALACVHHSRVQSFTSLSPFTNMGICQLPILQTDETIFDPRQSSPILSGLRSCLLFNSLVNSASIHRSAKRIHHLIFDRDHSRAEALSLSIQLNTSEKWMMHAYTHWRTELADENVSEIL